MFESEITLAILVGTWILYELYGRTAIQWLVDWTWIIRIGGVLLFVGYFLYQNPTDTLSLAKQVFLDPALRTTVNDSKEGREGKEKRNVTGLMKKKVAADQKWVCGHCSQTLDESYEVDHKLALYKGGSNSLENLVALCRNCHGKKTMAERLE